MDIVSKVIIASLVMGLGAVAMTKNKKVIEKIGKGMVHKAKNAVAGSTA